MALFCLSYGFCRTFFPPLALIGFPCSRQDVRWREGKIPACKKTEQGNCSRIDADRCRIGGTYQYERVPR